MFYLSDDIKKTKKQSSYYNRVWQFLSKNNLKIQSKCILYFVKPSAGINNCYIMAFSEKDIHDKEETKWMAKG